MSEPYFTSADGCIVLHHGDCREVLPTLEADSIDAIVTDPPYDLTNRVPDVKKCRDCGRVLGGRDGRPPACPKCGGELYNQRSQGKGFMGKDWDGTGIAFDVALWREVLRVAKPGAHLVAFGGTRTHHRMMVALEDAGWEIRDCLMWLFGSGFPKSLSVDKAIDKAAGAEREVVGQRQPFGREGRATYTAATGIDYGKYGAEHGGVSVTAPATPDAERWQGWGTALKPAYEPIVLCRKPLSEKTVAANVLRWGTGAINVDASRIGTADTLGRDNKPGQNGWKNSSGGPNRATYDAVAASGRWPANAIFSHSLFCTDVACDPSCPIALLDAQSGVRPGGTRPARRSGIGYHGGNGTNDGESVKYDTGGASRYFLNLPPDEPTRFRYQPKAPRSERVGSTHPTQKPVALMRYLIRLITPPGGVILDPFAGSGSTLCAIQDSEYRAVGIELHEEYCAIAAARQPKQRRVGGVS